MIVLASLLPIVLYLIVLKMFDSFSLIKWGRLAMCLGAGIAACLVTLLTVRLAGNIEAGGVSLVPVIEELLKGALMIWLVLSKKVRFMAETLIYGASAGGGFALAENTVYFLENQDMTVLTAIFRGFDCAFLHIGCTALIATLMLLAGGAKLKIVIPLALIPSIVLHLLHNQVEVSPSIKMVCTLVVFTGLFIVLFNKGEKKVYGWMDHSISIDIRTLSSIKEGNFSATKAGTYLLGMKEQFRPEVFFDMINYVELFLDLKIEKQSMMLLSQAGFTAEETGINGDGFQSKVAELAALKKMIGKTGYNVLSPLVREEN